MATAILIGTVPLSRILDPPRTTWQPSASVVAGIIVGVTVALFAPVLRAVRGSADAARGLRPVEFMLPRGAQERLLWVAVAITAGVCEEIIFRGFPIRYFEPWIGLGPVIVAAAAVFALDDAYQGLTGVVTSFAVALLFTFLFFLTGSLWIPIVIHAALDLRVLAMFRG